MSKDKKNITAAELMQKLEQDPEYLARRATKEEKFRKLREKNAEWEQPLLDKLRTEGFSADSFVDLIKKYAPLPSQLVEILLSRIDVCNDVIVNEWIIRALAVARKSFDGTKLCFLYDNTRDINLKWVIANTIACINPHSIDEWLGRAKQDAYLRKTLEKLGFDWQKF